MTLKLLSDKPVFAPEFGVYSHLIGEQWLAGGASNSGGKVLSHYFTDAALATLSTQMDIHKPTGLDYYPLPGIGERFPLNDPALPPRLSPRPENDAQFLQAMLEGMVAIETLGYQCLVDHGAPALRSLRTVGGGAANPGWTALRQRSLRVPFAPALSTEAAAGTARLAVRGATALQLWQH
jgi:sugar (pentulose or hexulose) kinase